MKTYRINRTTIRASAASLLVLTLLQGPTAWAAAEFIGPSPYLSRTNSPFFGTTLAGITVLQDFEQGFTNGLGVSVSPGGILTTVEPTKDSVDADDGLIDGSGLTGHSWWVPAALASVTFSFDASQLGGLPTHAGIVWTDGNQDTTVTFEAFDASTNSLGTVVTTLGDNSVHGTTAEDRFFGVRNATGISAISIKNVGGLAVEGALRGLEVDHLQYGGGPLRVTIQVADVDVCWNSESNQLYQVQYRSQLTTNTWLDLGSPILGDGFIKCITDSVRGQPQKFYRVVSVP